MSEQPHTPTVTDALSEVEKTVRDRTRRYPEKIQKGYLKPETAAAKLAAMIKAQDVLRFVEANEDWIRSVYAQRVRMAREAEELSLTDPAVQAVLAEFPGAEIVDVDVAHYLYPTLTKIELATTDPVSVS